MSEPEKKNDKTVIEVTRIGHHYFYGLTRAGMIVAKNQLIPKERAIEIVGEHEDGRHKTLCYGGSNCVEMLPFLASNANLSEPNRTGATPINLQTPIKYLTLPF